MIREVRAQASQALNPLATAAVAVALAPVALWVWMARETGRGRNWARGLSTVLLGLAAVWLLWRPASDAFFRPPGLTQAQDQAQMAGPARIRSARAQMPRQV